MMPSRTTDASVAKDGSAGSSGSQDSGDASAGMGGNDAAATSGGSGGRGAPSDCGGIAIPMGTGGPSGGVWRVARRDPGRHQPRNSDFNNDNYGAQDVLVDPARPSDFYAFFCHQGVYKSTDYGQSWKKVNTGENGDDIDSGKPWGEAIDTNRCRDPSTPPTLYSAGSQGRSGGPPTVA